jgi:soluble lytic murein transglycosylase-like protein
VARLLTERRTSLLALLSGLGLLVLGRSAWAGAQTEEPLADSVRTVLSAAVADDAPPVPDFVSSDARIDYLRWLTKMSARLRRKEPALAPRTEFLQTLWYESTRAGLEPALVLALIQVESNFRKFAVSRAGARGYMQVMPFWIRWLSDGDSQRLFGMQTNLRFGCVILRHYLDREGGDLFMALGRYNGSRGQAIYPAAVLGAKTDWLP